MRLFSCWPDFHFFQLILFLIHSSSLALNIVHFYARRDDGRGGDVTFYLYMHILEDEPHWQNYHLGERWEAACGCWEHVAFINNHRRTNPLQMSSGCRCVWNSSSFLIGFFGFPLPSCPPLDYILRRHTPDWKCFKWISSLDFHFTVSWTALTRR